MVKYVPHDRGFVWICMFVFLWCSLSLSLFLLSLLPQTEGTHTGRSAFQKSKIPLHNNSLALSLSPSFSLSLSSVTSKKNLTKILGARSYKIIWPISSTNINNLNKTLLRSKILVRSLIWFDWTAIHADGKSVHRDCTLTSRYRWGLHHLVSKIMFLQENGLKNVVRSHYYYLSKHFCSELAPSLSLCFAVSVLLPCYYPLAYLYFTIDLEIVIV